MKTKRIGLFKKGLGFEGEIILFNNSDDFNRVFNSYSKEGRKNLGIKKCRISIEFIEEQSK